MATFGYLMLWFYALVAALVLGFASHYFHASFQPYPDKLIDGDGWSDKLLNEMMSPEYRFWGVYDEAGWWEFYSLRNYATHAVPPLLIVVAGGLLLWGDRAVVVAAACAHVAKIGMLPQFCG